MSGDILRPESTQNPRVTWEGCSVLLDINDGDRLVFARLSPGSKLKIGSKNYSLKPLIGCPFGSLFQIENGSEGPCLVRTVPSSEDVHVQEKSDSEINNEIRDNRAIVDDNTAQNLTSEEIDAMQRHGTTGDDIVKALIANSATFNMKSSFSQEKYRLRKQKKYAPRVLLRRPFARRTRDLQERGVCVTSTPPYALSVCLGALRLRPQMCSICEAYFKKYPARIGFLRVDALSLLLSMANVKAHSDVLVVDMLGGLLTGAVAERLGGTGHVCNTYLGATPLPMDIVKMFNFSSEICGRILCSSLSELFSRESEIPKKTNDRHDNVHTVEGESNEEMPSDKALSHPDSTEEMDDLGPEVADSLINQTCKPAKPGKKASSEIVRSWIENGFSSLIIASPELDAWSMVRELLPLLSFSAPFAIYHQYLQPLATCMHNLQMEKMAIGLQISEPWLREYQVLPSRTHPCMQMSAFGGYILSGTRICCGESPP